MADPRTSEIIQDSVKIYMRSRPTHHEARNPALSAQEIDAFAEFRSIGRNSPESRPIAAEPDGWRIRAEPIFFAISRSHIYAIDRRIARRATPPPFRPA